MKIWGLILCLLATGCASVGELDPLYPNYRLYAEAVDANALSADYPLYFSRRVVDQVAGDQAAFAQLGFKAYMLREHSHSAAVGEDSGCLTVNGYGIGGEPLTFYLAYVQEGAEWLIDDVNVVFLEPEQAFGTTAKCPEETRVNVKN
ncbi:hypothetical protein [Hahella sp. NBU794]|uniref:hypothetical protein n=1 Tax=Hahella sp. NBU794 TaxID=3422590 RepID=UPI003D6DD4D8